MVTGTGSGTGADGAGEREVSGRWVDFHNHVIPGVDDGARDVAEGVAGVEALVAEGVDHVVASPHVDGSLTHKPEALGRRLRSIDAAFEHLRTALEERSGAPILGRGVELKLDVPTVILDDPRLRLAGGRAVLVEFPFMTIPPRSAQALLSIRRAGYLPVLAHPERYNTLSDGLGSVERWLDAGTILQVNAGSLVGRYGSGAQRVAHAILARGWAHAVASDYHSRGSPRLAEARQLVEEWGGSEAAGRLFHENPLRLLRGEECVPVGALGPPRSLGDRLLGLFGLR